MARPKKYPVRRMIALSEEMDQNLQATAKIMGVQPAVAGRIIIDSQTKNITKTDPAKVRKLAENSAK